MKEGEVTNRVAYTLPRGDDTCLSRSNGYDLVQDPSDSVFPKMPQTTWVHLNMPGLLDGSFTSRPARRSWSEKLDIRPKLEIARFGRAGASGQDWLGHTQS
jgi:hypothetical protein